MNKDNTSIMKLAKNRKRSSGKIRRHIKIRYFFVTDKFKKEEIKLIHCQTKGIIADYLTKSSKGKTFWYFKDLLMGVPMVDYEEYKLQYEFLACGRKELADTKKDCINKAWTGRGCTTITNEWKHQEGRE